ncbi:alpha/beta hydrolase family esterase [Paenibacillus sp. YIM B09110]|uniref:alpha/beta hydrolase family esterase n=1 Tax=Paenibacillus sp. YIM B09110 TaxID=3126102 RepID=UPI00301D987A
MNQKIVIIPGTPNDENRDYLPELIKSTDMVVNENGNNSQVYPARLSEYTDVVLDGMEHTWYEYVPASYDGTRDVPLILSMHGGLMTGWGQAVYTSWTLVAEREGFIVLFPNAGRDKFWVVETEKEKIEAALAFKVEGKSMHVPPENPEDNQDMNMVLVLIERAKNKYKIDEGRIFIQGMSMGNMMTSQMARHHGKVFAGKAGSGGPSSPGVLFDKNDELLNQAGPIAVWQTRLEHDQVPPHFHGDTDYVVKRNREYWKRINQCRALPEIKIAGEDNFAFYKGEHADVVFRDVKNRDHGQTFDDAEVIWDYLFSGIRRGENGEIVNSEPLIPRKGDDYAIALAAGSAKAYVNNRLITMRGPVMKHQKLKYHGLSGDAIVRGEYFMVPVSFLADVFDATFSSKHGGHSVELQLKDGMTMQFARGSIGCVVDNRVHSMYCEAVLQDGELYVPIEWICKRLFNNHVSSCGDVLYITDHDAELSLNMALLIRDEILTNGGV